MPAGVLFPTRLHVGPKTISTIYSNRYSRLDSLVVISSIEKQTLFSADRPRTAFKNQCSVHKRHLGNASNKRVMNLRMHAPSFSISPQLVALSIACNLCGNCGWYLIGYRREFGDTKSSVGSWIWLKWRADSLFPRIILLIKVLPLPQFRILLR